MNVRNVIIVNDYANVNGGSAKVAIESALLLCKYKINVVFFSAVGPIDNRLIEAGIKVVCLNIKDILHERNRLKAAAFGVWNIQAKNGIRKIISHFKTENTIIHIHGWTKALSSSIFLPVIKEEYKVVVTTHDYFSVCPNGGFFDYQTHRLCELVPMSIKCISCNCDKRSYIHKLFRVIRQYIQDKYIRNNPNINFISISEQNEFINKKYTVSQNYTRILNPMKIDSGIASNDNYSGGVVYVGRISEEKGTDIFCDAVQKLIQKEKNIKAIVIGDGDDIEKYRFKYPEIDFLGWKNHDEVLQIIKASHVLVLPSRCYEGAPLTIIEAMMLDVPCIVSNSTSAIEIVNNKNGYIFESENVDDLERCFRESLIAEDYDKKREFIKKEFDPSAYDEEYHINSLIDLYERLLVSKK